ncbi:uncharacterized protein LOC110460413 [Mizuhopecten yessoensis]|uniref:uncharacterized protein LOC110460413 n=1 Tax=Mizuhopecten yessoensis TaxID=6573 RepID=UPI000B45E8F4|nr:uncharacterized protein LOC110460413 [Mizuhopecten yessoensis]
MLLNVRLSEFDSDLKGLGNVFDSFNEKCQSSEQLTKNVRDQTIRLENQVKNVQEVFSKYKSEKEKELMEVAERNDEMAEQLTDLRCRSIKYHLVFSGIYERDREDTESVIREFLDRQLDIGQHIELANVHRFGRKSNKGPRPVVVKFIFQKELDMVLKNAKKLRGKPYRINKQFPQEIEQARKSLYPKFKEFREKGDHVKLVRDILYVNGQPYDDVRSSTPQATRSHASYNSQETPNRRRNPKRGRMSSTHEGP